jgi:hypothetical protein
MLAINGKRIPLTRQLIILLNPLISLQAAFMAGGGLIDCFLNEK